MGNTATRKRTSVKRQGGESWSQCAATNSKTPAQSSTPPRATASRTGQRRRSLDPCDSSNVRMRAAVLVSTTPAEIQRSSCLSRGLATVSPPLYGYCLRAYSEPALCLIFCQETPALPRLRHSRCALLVHHPHAGFGVA